MAIPDEDVQEFRQLAEAAQDAVHELLKRASHDAFPTLRRGWRELDDWLERCGRYDEARAKLERDQAAAAGRAEVKANEEAREGQRREILDHWRRMAREARENLLLNVLNTDCITVAEITRRVNDALGAGDCRVLSARGRPWAFYPVSETVVRQHLKAMVSGRQLQKEKRAVGKVQIQHFQRRAGLDGEIGNLERAFHEEA